MFYSRRLFSK